MWARELDLYGNAITGDSSFIPFLYQGQYYDEEIGLAYNRFRYYCPETGAYISQDPIGLSGGNPTIYGYVKDSNWWVDVFGLNCKRAIDKAKEYEKQIQDIYGENLSQSEREYTAILEGKEVKGVADYLYTKDGKKIAIEAKYVDNWDESIRNPNGKKSSLPFASNPQNDMLLQAQKYSQAFDEVIYHTNSRELKEHYSKVFKEAGLNNITFIETSYNG